MLGYSNAMATAATALDRQSPWRDELRATLALAWPLILTNITMVLINSTDVFLLARLGPGALAASAMGSGIVIAMLLIGIGGSALHGCVVPGDQHLRELLLGAQDGAAHGAVKFDR